MIPQIGSQMAEYFKNASEEERIVEMKDVFGRFALDAIATTNFGVQVNSLKEKDNPFYKKVQALVDMKSLDVHIRFMLIFHSSMDC